MSGVRMLCVVATAAVALSVSPRAAAGETIAFTGCVVSAPAQNVSVPNPLLLVWSEEDMVLTDVAVQFQSAGPVGTSGRAPGHVLYWLDDDADDVAKYAGRRVQVIGTIDEEYGRGEVEIDEQDGFVEIEVDFDGEETKARMPRWMFGTHPIDAEFDVLVREVDVREVNLLPAPCR